MHTMRTRRESAHSSIERALLRKTGGLKDRKQRVLDTFFDGVINKSERDASLAEIDRETDAYQHILSDTVNLLPL